MTSSSLAMTTHPQPPPQGRGLFTTHSSAFLGKGENDSKNKVENEAKRFDPKEKICGANQVSFVGNRVERIWNFVFAFEFARNSHNFVNFLPKIQALDLNLTFCYAKYPPHPAGCERSEAKTPSARERA